MSEFTSLPKKNSKNLFRYQSCERCLPNDAERCWMQAVQMEIVSMKNPLKGEDSSPVTGSTVSRQQNLTAWIKYRVNWCLPLVIASHKSHSLPAITRNLNPCQLPWSLVAVGSTFQVCRAGVNLSGPQGSSSYICQVMPPLLREWHPILLNCSTCKRDFRWRFTNLISSDSWGMFLLNHYNYHVKVRSVPPSPALLQFTLTSSVKSGGFRTPPVTP